MSLEELFAAIVEGRCDDESDRNKVQRRGQGILLCAQRKGKIRRGDAGRRRDEQGHGVRDGGVRPARGG